MARPLVFTAVAGIGISIACFVLASMLSPYGGSYPFGPNYYDSKWWESRPPWTRYVPFAESGETVTRDFAWTGGDRVEIYIPGVVHFESAPQWTVTVTGPKSSVDHLRIEHGAILFDAPLTYPHTSTLEVHIRGPSLNHVGLNGTGRLILERIAQEEIAIDIRGAGSVQGSGNVRQLGLRIFGSGDAKLAALATEDVDASIFGSGNADIAPSGAVEVSIFGSGDVRLYAKPKHVATRLFGSGRVVELEPKQEVMSL